MRETEWVRPVGGVIAVVACATVLMLPTPDGMTLAAHRLMAVTAMMVVLWLTQAIPIAVTSLIPIAAYPLLGIRAIDSVTRSYAAPYVFLFMGGFLIAIAIEKWNLHRRMALHIVSAMGFGQRRVVFGFMVATAFLSMWISNTASTMLMLPIGLALVTAIGDIVTARNPGQELDPQGFPPELSRLSRALLLGIAYGASCGGLTTPIGTLTNSAFLGFWEGREELAAAPAPSTAEWLAVWGPMSLVMLVCVGCVLTWRLPRLAAADELGRNFFRDRLREMGPATRQEKTMFLIFLSTAALWLFRKPLQFGDVTLLPGWGPYLQEFLSTHWRAAPEAVKGAVHDAGVAIAMAILTFCIPAGRDEQNRPRRLMDWETAEKRLPWGMLLLVGGGFALADAFDATRLSPWVGSCFEEVFRGAATWQLVLGICLLMTFLTEFTTNVVMIQALLPILLATAISLRIDPRLLLIPATISASCAFMLPISTPPNAIVFGSRRIAMRDMMSFGLVLNLIGVALVTIFTLTVMVPVFDIVTDGPPDWLPPPPTEAVPE